MEQYEQEDLLEEEIHLEQASHIKRFANYIIDFLSFYAVIIIVMSIAAIIYGPDILERFQNDAAGFGLVENLIALLAYAFYLSVVEAVFKGKTLGKLITGTRAVREDGSNITTAKAFERGLCRAVPFNILSAIGTPCYPWHDRWTRTYVISEKNSFRGIQQ